MTTPVAVVGAGGYTGQELVELITRHHALRLVGVFASANSAGTPISEIAPRLRGIVNPRVQETNAHAIAQSGATHVFLATPHELSMQLAPKLIEYDQIVLDLSGAYRLKNLDLYPVHYGFEHLHPSSVEEALYTIPELCSDKIPRAKLISLAGCYATSVILPLVPLVRAGLLEADRTVIVDSVSGVSGAGKKPAAKTSFCEVSQSPYAVLSHRHEPEMIEHTGTDIMFTPHLGPYARGILSTIHVDLSRGTTRPAIEAVLQEAFADSPFVRLLPDGAWPSVGGVTHTNMIDIGFAVDEKRCHLVLVSAIDNLLKGASGQAIQALNLHLGIDERTGLMPGATT
ncbi:MAG: N-acetyl-gamma-glutamyl-phosphate reductase [Phycisphaera sp.]|nr:MAG: N-acetyl-gamma-glutamyl-phosphate reductase [Phycisphaera sp.]